MNAKPKISVIIPIYNAEKYLEKCLDSIVNQTLKDIEIICVNDGSTDNSKKIIEKYSEKYKNIKLINQENKGAIEARINGYNNAFGEYITFVDNDDFLEKNMYEVLYKNAKKENLDMCICNYKFFPNKNKNKMKWFKPYKGTIDYNFIQHNVLLWNRIVKNDLLENIGFVNLFRELGEGAYSIVVINSKKIKTIDKCFYNYRVGHSSLSTNLSNIKYFEQVVKQEKNRMSYAKNNIKDKEWINYFTFSYLYYCQLMMVVGAYNKNKKIYKKYKDTIIKNKFYSNIYKKYYSNNLSKTKYLFFKYIGSKSYYLMSIFIRILY